MESEVSIFSSGRMISVRGKSLKAARHDLIHVQNSLSEHGLIANNPLKILLRNLVSTVDTGKPINLEELALAISGAVYELEQFPGVILRPQVCSCSALVFSSGKIVVSGLGQEDDVVSICKAIVDEIESY